MQRLLIHLTQRLKITFVALKAEVDKVNINKQFESFKINVHDLGVDNLKSVPADLKILSNLVINEVVEKTKITH